MNDVTRRRLIMIAMDAAEASLVERWMAEGVLPNLARLRERGAWGRLESPASFLNAAAWPTFVAGMGPARNGIYNYLIWDPDTLSYERPGPDLPDLPPFWRRAADECGVRTIALDIPYVYPAEDFDGLELHGWAGHYKLVPTFTLPPSWLKTVHRKFGEAPIEGYGPGILPVRKYFELRDKLVAASRRATDMAATLIEREAWDLFLISLSATHSGGHQLWDATNVRGEMTAKEAEELDGALRRSTSRADRAVGQLLEAAGETPCLVFALHGMGDNTGLGVLLPEMLDRVLAGGPPADDDDVATESPPSPSRGGAGGVAQRGEAPTARRPAGPTDAVLAAVERRRLGRDEGLLSPPRPRGLRADQPGRPREAGHRRSGRGIRRALRGNRREGWARSCSPTPGEPVIHRVAARKS